MPPKAKITKEQIIEKAYELVKKHGFGCLSARYLAQELGCSTQPIYLYFKDMKELQKEVANKAGNTMLEYVKKESQDNQPMLLAQMLGYVKFANEEENLYQLMFVSGVFADQSRSGESPATDELGMNMTIYAHGIVMMQAFGKLALPWEQTRNMIIKAYRCFESGLADH